MILKDNLNILGKTKRSTKTFSVLMKKEITKIDKDDNESIKTISYKRKLIDNVRFMATSLSKILVISQKKFIRLSLKIVVVSLNLKVSRMI